MHHESDSFSSRLAAAIKHKGSPVCVGLDPRKRMLPKGLLPATWFDETDPIALLETIKPTVEKAGLTMAINEAWALVAIFTAMGLLLIPFVRRIGKTSGPAEAEGPNAASGA